MLKVQSNELEDHKYTRAFIGPCKDWHSTFMLPAALENCKVTKCASGGGRIGAFFDEFIGGCYVDLVPGSNNGKGGKGGRRKGEKEKIGRS